LITDGRAGRRGTLSRRAEQRDHRRGDVVIELPV
jgi:hypothetical protein